MPLGRLSVYRTYGHDRGRSLDGLRLSPVVPEISSSFSGNSCAAT